MPLHVRSIAVSIAVVFFFGISLIGWVSGLSPFTCCKRALAGAALAYMAGALTVKAINAVLMNALVTKQMNERKEETGGNKD